MFLEKNQKFLFFWATLMIILGIQTTDKGHFGKKKKSIF